MGKLILGCIPSTIDGTEKIFELEEKIEIPEAYSYRDVLPPVLNQGNQQICVPCTLSAYLNWKENLKNGSNNDNNINLFDIYKNRSNYGEGMSYKDAFKYLKNKGVKSNNGLLKINSYGRVMSPMLLKYAIIMNGPCFGALPVYSDRCDFWKQKYREDLEGYHAIALVGYDENGIIIRNSWGKNFCNDGYTVLPYEDFDKLLEIWTILD